MLQKLFTFYSQKPDKQQYLATLSSQVKCLGVRYRYHRWWRKKVYEIVTRNKCYKKGFIKYGEKTDKQ